MSKIKEKTTGTIEVLVTKIEVDDRYYTINYKYSIDGKTWKKAEVNSDYESWERDEFEEFLRGGDAVKIALEDVMSEYE